MNRRWICAGAGALMLAGGLGAVSAQAAAGHGTGGVQQRARMRLEGAIPELTALQVTAAGPPRFVYGSDGRTHVDYDLLITNVFTAGATLRSLTVTSGGPKLLRLADGALAEHTRDLARPGDAAIGPHPGVGDAADAGRCRAAAGGRAARAAAADQPDRLHDPAQSVWAAKDRKHHRPRARAADRPPAAGGDRPAVARAGLG